MEHVIARIAEEILHALLALDDRTDRSAQLALQADLGWSSLHNVFGVFHRRCVAVLLAREVYDLVVGIGIVSFVRQCRRMRSDPVSLLRLKKRSKDNSQSTWTDLTLITTQLGIERPNI